ncbi:hypothetical protein FA13DRAFT_1799468 [Coprinellus micaceus]|uniref:Uncharacterized protein n=1 Tax=Coprinellus micaceus TaxID=71717 RepID=A0A4Y7SJG2_COPMI|nr:hypothetical protein FA13DRAFT_1799468 [Coprinellus micaceus]
MRFLLFILSFLYITSAVAFGSVVARRASPVSSSELETLTNAQRLARGLPPRAPKRLYAPTRVRRDPLPSSAPVCLYLSTIQTNVGSYMSLKITTTSLSAYNVGPGSARYDLLINTFVAAP